MAEPRGDGPAAVVHVITLLELGGAQQNTLFTVAHLDRARFTPWLVHGPGGILDAEAASLEGVRVLVTPHLVREVRPRSDLAALGELTSSLRQVRRGHPGPLVVHTHSSKAGILGRLAARRAGADAVVHSVHGFGFTPGQAAPVRGLFVGLERLAARWTDAFVCVSRANLEEGVRRGIFPRGKAVLIRSGFDLAEFRAPSRSPAEVRRELGIPEDAPVAGMVACFKPQKAPADFVGAMALVARDLPEAHFVVAGDGELRPEVERAAAAAGLGGRLHLLGWRRDVPDLLHALDLLVLTSRWEGLPRVVPQAMAAGKPVVATAVDGTPEAVADGETGFLVPPGDVAAIAARALEVLRDPALARRLGEEGRSRVAEFDAVEMVRRQEALYLRLLARK